MNVTSNISGMPTNGTLASMSWDSPNVLAAIGVAIGAGLATGIGGLVAFFPNVLRSVPQATVLAIALSLSAGVMLYVSFIEIFVKAHDAIAVGFGPDASAGAAAGVVTLCFFAGMAFMVLLEWAVHALLRRHGSPGSAPAHCHGELQPPPTATNGDARKKPLAPAEVAVGVGDEEQQCENGKLSEEERRRLGAMGVVTCLAIALHNFPEGLATFLATVADPSVGAALGVAIAVHNIPEGVCVAMPIYYATGSAWKAFGWSLLSGVTEPIGGVLGFAVLQPVFTDLVFGVIFSMVGGMMVFIVLHELLPAAHRYMPRKTATVTLSLVLGMAIMALSLVLFVM